MKQKHYLVVGASSVAGQKAIEAIRQKDPDARITVTTSKAKPADAQSGQVASVFGIDLAKPDTIHSIKAQLPAAVDVLVFCPAFGMVGYPAELAPMSDVEACFNFSVRPVLALIDELNPQLTIGFSSFYWLRSLEVAYGSMAFAKYALEKLAVENPNHIRIVRAGLFPSKSLRAICLLIQRGVQKESFPGATELKAGWKASGLAFADYFTQFAQGYEKADLSQHLTAPYRGTEDKDLVAAIGAALEPNAKGIINVVGDSLWQESSLDNVPDFMVRNKEAFALAESFDIRHANIA
ncbi:MAG: hypothetical protein U1F16_15770 [Turneriella sp.]